jgi:hypothetical protein
LESPQRPRRHALATNGLFFPLSKDCLVETVRCFTPPAVNSLLLVSKMCIDSMIICMTLKKAIADRGARAEETI